MDGNYSSTFRSSIFPFLLCEKFSHSLFFYHLAVFHQAGMIAGIITFFQPFYLLTWIFITFKTICNLPLCHTILYPAMLRFSLVTFQTTYAWLLMITMLITNRQFIPPGANMTGSILSGIFIFNQLL